MRIQSWHQRSHPLKANSSIGATESDVREEPARESSSHSKARPPRVDDLLVMQGQQLRDRLNSIIGFSELLAHSDQLSEGHRRYAAHIQSSSRKLMGVLTDILALARCICELTEVSGVDVHVVSRPDGEMSLVAMRTDKQIVQRRESPTTVSTSLSRRVEATRPSDTRSGVG